MSKAALATVIGVVLMLMGIGTYVLGQGQAGGGTPGGPFTVPPTATLGGPNGVGHDGDFVITNAAEGASVKVSIVSAGGEAGEPVTIALGNSDIIHVNQGEKLKIEKGAGGTTATGTWSFHKDD